MCDTPTVKSYKIKVKLGQQVSLKIEAKSLDALQSIRGYLEDYLVRLGDERGAFEFSPSHDLRLDDAFFLPNAGFLHVLLLEHGELRLPLRTKDKVVSIFKGVADGG